MSTPEAARAHLTGLIDVLPSLPPVVRREVRDVAGLAEAPPDWWPAVYGDVLAAGLASSDTETERETWQKTVDRLINGKAKIV
jgi:hypothetical protein